MRGRDSFDVSQVGDRSCDTEGPVKRAEREPETFDDRGKQAPSRAVEKENSIEVGDWKLGVAKGRSPRKTMSGQPPGRLDTLADGSGSFGHASLGHICPWHGRNANVKVDAVEERSRQFAGVPLPLSPVAGAGELPISGEPAGAWQRCLSAACVSGPKSQNRAPTRAN